MPVRAFFEDLGLFGDHPAIIRPEDGFVLSYEALEQRVRGKVDEIGLDPKLVFIEGTNTIETIVNYLATLRTPAAVHLLEDAGNEKGQRLIEAYRPNLILREHAAEVFDAEPPQLHPDLKLLLSTSGSTGSPKFVKLSQKNIQSNTEAITEYLGLTKEERAFCHLKPFYSFGLSIINSHLQCGGSLVLSQKSMMEPEFWVDFKASRATSFSGVPYNYEMLYELGFDPAAYEDLRYATQAGGKLRGELVSHFVEAFAAAGKDFFVMYGQTEAAPRMSYLKPDDARTFPDSIGQAIPGGELFLIDDEGETVTAAHDAELAYRGPNVMMGYATDRSELASDETPDYLRTGDIARRLPGDLFQIVGRRKRFVKLFGSRINLDSVEQMLKEKFGTLAVTGNDERLAVALVSEESDALRRDVQSALSETLEVPQKVIAVRFYESLPFLPNGKVSYLALEQDFNTVNHAPLVRRVWDGFLEILGLSAHQCHTVKQAFEAILMQDGIDETESFESLGADSLAFVGLQIELDHLFAGNPPETWTSLSIATLDEQLASQK